VLLRLGGGGRVEEVNSQNLREMPLARLIELSCWRVMARSHGIPSGFDDD
jgi:hypothetical protein